ncbi:MAG: helix-turn-helix domain-containing protein [Verrucomicrobia bacterium]|nr:helix-turn-helix domain-containing protein [Verrucomicrobiota bacterium]
MNEDAVSQGSMFSSDQSESIFVNVRCMIYRDQDMCAVMHNGIPIARYHVDDRLARDIFIAQALDAGFATADELAAAYGISKRTAYRMLRRYRDDGVRGLEHKRPGPKGPRIGAAREAAILRWSKEGRTAGWMAQRLKVGRRTVERALERNGLPTRRQAARQVPLFDGDHGADCHPPVNSDGLDSGAADLEGATGCSASGEAGPLADHPVTVTYVDGAVADQRDASARAQTADSTEGRSSGDVTALAAAPAPVCVPLIEPFDRRPDRLLAAQGLLHDAVPMFGPGEHVPRAGVLLAVPAVVGSGVLDVAEEVFGTIGPAFYGLRTAVVTMVFLALLRIKHPENVKEYAPPELGRILGLDRAPEVKTVRRKLGRLAADAPTVERFLAKLAERRVALAEDALGYLYVDGHVRVYHGKADIPKHHVARMRLSMPATQDVWVNDSNGDPVFLITQEPNAQLVSALPTILEEVRRLIGDRRVTVVFDRGGWSPTLFKKLSKNRFDVLTYRKGTVADVADDEFVAHTVQTAVGKVTYRLSERDVVVGEGLCMRQVTRLKDGHQTHIVTTRMDLSPGEIACRMFDRWRQENFFRYMRQQYALDALVEHGTEPDDPNRMVPNPERKRVDAVLVAAKKELERMKTEYHRACAEGLARETVRPPGFTPIYGMELQKSIDEASRRVEQLEAERGEIPPRVRIGDIKDEVVRLRRRRKQISDAFKIVAYQAETDLARAVAPHFARSVHEGRRLIRSALLSAADIESTDTEIRITLAPQSTAARTAALASLCRHLDAAGVTFPGTRQRLRYAIRGHATDT